MDKNYFSLFFFITCNYFTVKNIDKKNKAKKNFEF